MSERIDNLSIGITASAAQAVKAIERVNAALGKTGAAGKGAAGGLKPTKDKMEDVAGSSQKAGDEVKKVSDKIKEAGDKAKESAKTTNKLRDALSKIKVGSGLKGLGTFFKNQLFGGIQSAISAANTLFSSLKRIAFYRAIRSAIKFITQGLSEGIENLYRWSDTADGKFKNSMDSLATSALYLKNSFAAMVSPLIEAVAPAIDFVVDKIVGFFNTVNQVFAALTGKSTYTVAKKVATVWKDIDEDAEDAVDNVDKKIKKTADDAKKYINTILPFDEINKLNGVNDKIKDTDTSTPKTKDKDKDDKTGIDYSTMFETRKINSGIVDFVNKLKDAFNRGDWKGLGKLLGDKVNELVNKVDWAGLGRKVGYYINGWFSTKYWTLKTINFTKIGQSIATFLNNAISQINFNTIGRYFVRKLTAIADMIIGFFKTFDFGQLAGAMSDFVIGMLEELTDWLGETDWYDFGETLANKLIDIITHIKWAEIADAFFTAMNAALLAGLNLLAGFFEGLAAKIENGLNWDTLDQKVKNMVMGLMVVLGGALLAVGAILAFSGANIPLGIGLMIAGAVSLGTAAALKWNLKDEIEQHANAITNVVHIAGLAIGAILAFSGANIPLGIGLMVFNAGALIHDNVDINWNSMYEKLKEAVLNGSALFITSAALLVLGAILAFTGVAIPTGIALMLSGISGISIWAANADWDSIGKQIKQALMGVYNWVNNNRDALFVIGMVLALSGVATPLGLAIIAGNIVWGAVEKLGGPQEIINKISEWWGTVVDWWNSYDNPLKITFLVAGAVGVWWNENVVPWWNKLKDKSLKIGLSIKDSASTWYSETVVPWATDLANKTLKIGLAIKNSAATWWKKTVIPWWDSLDNYHELKIAFSIIESAVTWWNDTIVPWWDGLGDNKVLGIGLGFTKTVSELASDLFDSIKRTWDAAAYKLTIDIIPRIGSMFNLSGAGKWLAEKLGFGKGMAGSLADYFLGNANAEELSVDVAVNAVPGANAQVTSGGIAPKVPPAETAVTVNAKPGLGLTVNSSGKPILAKLPDSKVDAIVTLTKNNWSTVVDWVTQAKGGDVKEGVELVKKGWTQIDKWAEQYKGGKLDQKIGLIRAGWSLISSWANKYNTKDVKQNVDLKRDGWTTVNSWVEQYSSPVQQGISLFVNNWNGFLTGVSNTLHSWFPNLFAEGGVIQNGKVSRFKDGGVINAYAGGTSRAHGSLFLAGEAGPEIVGHVGGRTEVLNKSQIAATMYEAVRSAMTGITIDANVYQGANGEGGNEAMLELIMEGNSATQREIDILREQNNILRQLLEKPVMAEISTNGIVNALSRKNKRDGTTVVPVNY